MAEQENSKDLISVLWSGADILRSKMDANEYKDYLLGIVFYKYLSDSFLIKVYDLIYDEKPDSLKVALDAYKEALEDESAEELNEQIKAECHYVIEPELTYTYFAELARNNAFNREQLQKAFNNIEQSDPLFIDLFTDIDLYSNRLGTGDQKQSDTISNLIKEIDKADLLNSDADVLGNINRTREDIRRHVGNHRYIDVQVFLDFCTIDGVVGRDVEVIYISRNLIILGDIGVGCFSRRGYLNHFTERFSLFHGLLGPHTGIEVSCFLLQEIIGNHAEFQACATTQEEHRVAFGNIQKFLKESYSLVNHWLEILGTMADFHN